MAADFMQLRSAADGQPSAFSYIGQHRYHVTLPADGDDVFTTAERVKPVLDMLRESARAHAFEVFAYCFLPEQLQLVIRGRRETSDMRGFLSEFRTASSAVVQPVLGQALWKKRYLERVLRKGEDVLGIARHIVREPVKRGLVTTPRDHPFSGSFVMDDAALMDVPEPALRVSPPEVAPSRIRPPGAPRHERKFFRGPGKRSGPDRKWPGRPDGKYHAKRHSSGKGGFRPKQGDGGSGGWGSGFPRRDSHGNRQETGNQGRGPAGQPGTSSRPVNRASYGPPGRKKGGGRGGYSHGFNRTAGGGGHSRGRTPTGGGTGPGFSAGHGRGKFGKRLTSPRGKRGPRKGSRPGGRRSSPGTGTS